MTGSVSPLYEPGMTLGRAGVVPGHDLTSEAALTKLSYLLALPNLTTEDVAKQMSISIRGEFTELSGPTFEHPSTQLPSHLAKLSALGYAINKGDPNTIKEILQGGPEWLVNEADYSGNTPMHLAATGPNIETLHLFLEKGGSVHLRNKAGHTPLYLAAQSGLLDHVRLLRKSGAHLHADEIHRAKLHAQHDPFMWGVAGAENMSTHADSSP